MMERLAFFKQDMNQQLLGWSGSYDKGKYEDIITKLDAKYMEDACAEITPESHVTYREFEMREEIIGQEGFFVPEENYYTQVLDAVRPYDIIFDIGAGDFRLDLLLAEKVDRVYAVEVNPTTVASALSIIGYDKPDNLFCICVVTGLRWISHQMYH